MAGSSTKLRAHNSVLASACRVNPFVTLAAWCAQERFGVSRQVKDIVTWRPGFAGPIGVVRTRKNERGSDSHPRSFLRVRTTPAPLKAARQVIQPDACKSFSSRSSMPPW